MRKKTIYRRMRLSIFTASEKDALFEKMKGTSDTATLKGEGQKKWVAVLKAAFLKKYQ